MTKVVIIICGQYIKSTCKYAQLLLFFLIRKEIKHLASVANGRQLCENWHKSRQLCTDSRCFFSEVGLSKLEKKTPPS